MEVREGARRQHRALGVFAVLQCWMRDLDGIVLERTQLEQLLNLERFKKTRVQWLREDLKPLFPYQFQIRASGSTSFASLFAARRSLTYPGGSMSTKERIEAIKQTTGLRFGVLHWNPSNGQRQALGGLGSGADEKLLSAYVALVAQGQISPDSLIPP
jgi:hypothetical protein